MEYISKRDRNRAIFTGVEFALCIVIIAYFMVRNGLSDMRPAYVINMSADLFAMVTGLILQICCLIDVQKTGNDIKYIMFLLAVTFLHVFSDAASWLIEGTPGLIALNMIDNTIYYLCESATVYFIWRYMTSLVKATPAYVRNLDKAVRYGLSLSILMRLINLFTGMYFRIGSDNIYVRGPLFPVSKIYTILVIIAVAYVIIKERDQLASHQFFASMIFLTVPVIVALVTVMFYGLSLSSAITMILLLLMYCVHNVTQGREKAAADYDLMLASAIQENILPRTFPYLPERKEFDIYATMTPAKEVGGDFYDFFMTDNDHLAFLIADVSGKGMPAALFMMVSRTMIKNQAMGTTHYNDPGWILEIVNDQLCEGNTMEYFVTAWMGILELSTGHLAYASAGHEYPVVSKDGSDFKLHKTRNSPPLGTMEGLSYRSSETDLKPGDTIFIYTDGVTEATNSSNELFGTERMMEALKGNEKEKLDKIDQKLRQSISDFVKDAPQFDDITMLGMRFNCMTEKED